jgi:hypothetical protein
MKQLHRRMSWQGAWQILEYFYTKHVSAESACQWLGIKRSRLYELKKQWLEARSYGKKDGQWLYQREGFTQRLPSEARSYLEEELTYLKNESPYFKGYFNFAVLAQQCQKIFGKRYHRNTIRRWAIKEGYYNPKEDSTGKPCIRFEMGAVGILWQHDSSHHIWLPRTRRMDVLILTEDDHSRKVVGGLLVPRDTTWHHLTVVRNSIEMYGAPLAYYVDNHSIFRPETNEHTQFTRALASVKIEVKFTAKAHPEAKGKIEKRFDYFQRRLPYFCERYHITNLTKANEMLKDVINDYNNLHVHDETKELPEKRWQNALKEGRSYLQPIPEKTPLDIVFALHFERAVKKDGTITFCGTRWKIPHAPIRRTVTVVLRPPIPRRPCTELYVMYKGSTLAHFVPGKEQLCHSDCSGV